MGCVWQEYQVLLERLHFQPTVAVLTGSGMNFMVGRVSYTLGLQGKPSIMYMRISSPCLISIFLILHNGLKVASSIMHGF